MLINYNNNKNYRSTSTLGSIQGRLKYVFNRPGIEATSTLAVYIYRYMHMNDVVTDWSYALVRFLVSMLFGAFPRTILAIFHIANVFVGLVPNAFFGQVVE